MRNADLNTK